MRSGTSRREYEKYRRKRYFGGGLNPLIAHLISFPGPWGIVRNLSNTPIVYFYSSSRVVNYASITFALDSVTLPKPHLPKLNKMFNGLRPAQAIYRSIRYRNLSIYVSKSETNLHKGCKREIPSSKAQAVGLKYVALQNLWTIDFWRIIKPVRSD